VGGKSSSVTGKISGDELACYFCSDVVAPTDVSLMCRKLEGCYKNVQSIIQEGSLKLLPSRSSSSLPLITSIY